ncbi:YtpR family tRNA-binding protein [Macrococcus sp. EM39E]|uniref:YtpR family tRNA-binding protein n=1 Tax=Macrococcus animalis TaxID=3395467 RepID=UPI0039BE59C7
MNIFYNKIVGDYLFITLEPMDGPFEYLTNGDIITIKKDDKVVGYNVIGVESLGLDTNGQVKLTEELMTQINDLLVQKGLEKRLEVDLSPKFVVGYVETCEKHPDADKLNVTTVDVGTEKLQIICGAKNIAQGQKVVVAKVGAVMPSGMQIKDAELRGVPSKGMICSERELGLTDSEEKKGILVLDDSRQIGEDFFKVE